MDDRNLNIENQDIENEEEYTECQSDDLANQIAIEEELKRIEIQDNPKSKIPKDAKNSKVYLESVEQAYTIGECFQILLGYGIDYNNALACATNIIQNRVEIKKFELQGTQVQQQIV